MTTADPALGQHRHTSARTTFSSIFSACTATRSLGGLTIILSPVGKSSIIQRRKGCLRQVAGPRGDGKDNQQRARSKMACRKAVSYHEAGHLVAYHVNRIPIDRIWIYEPREDREESERQEEWQGRIFGKIEEPRLRLIVTLVAPATNMRKFGTHFTGDKRDLEDAKNFCSAESIDFEDVMRDSQRFVDTPDHWASIDQIAHRLLEQPAKETLQFRQVVEVCGDVLQEWFSSAPSTPGSTDASRP